MNKRIYILLIVVMFVISIITIVSCKKQEAQSPFQSELPLDNTTITITPANEATEVAEPVVIEQSEAKVGIVPSEVGPAEKEDASGVFVKPTPDEIQTALKNAGCYQGDIDGKIGPKTKKAITDFQIDNGLDADGKIGPKTWAKLKVYLESKKE